MAKPVMGVLTRRKKVEKKQISTVSEEGEVLWPCICVSPSSHYHKLLVSENHLSALSSGTVMCIVLLLFTIKIGSKMPITVSNLYSSCCLWHFGFWKCNPQDQSVSERSFFRSYILIVKYICIYISVVVYLKSWNAMERYQWHIVLYIIGMLATPLSDSDTIHYDS